MVETNYPVFVEGQTLTRDDLNVLRDHLRDRDRTVGQLIGFGVNCGLSGEVQSDGLHISGGLAVDQLGEPLLLPAERVLPVPPEPDDVSFDFVTGTDGFTVVLTATDVVQSATGCAEEGCDGHAELHTTGVALRVVPGRLTGTRFDFSDEPLLSQTPLRVTTGSAVVGAFDDLRDELLNRIGGRLPTALRAKLASLSITSADLPALAAYKAAFLNEVLFAALDLLRGEALWSVTCLRSTTNPGVAVGWLHQAGGTWHWDCQGRHHWEPPTGLTLALLGGGCSAPSAPYLDRLVALIDTFALPPVPAPADPPKTFPGDLHICKGWKKPGFGCGIRMYPEAKALEKWRDYWTEQPFPPVPGYVDPPRPWEVYEIDSPDIADAGVIDLLSTFGAGVGDVVSALQELIAGSGVEPDVRLLSQSEADEIVGFAPTGAVSPSDTVIVVKDDLGKVAATGRIAAARSIRRVGTELPAATAAAEQALRVTTEMSADVSHAVDQVNAVAGSIQFLDTFRTSTQTWRTTVDASLAGIETRITTFGNQEFTRLRNDILAQLPGLAANAVNGLRSGVIEQVTHTIDAKVAERSDKMRDDFGSNLDEVKELAAELTTTVALNGRTMEQLGGRIDNLYTGKYGTMTGLSSTGVSLTEAGGQRNEAVNTGLLRMLETMRSSVEAAAGADRADAVRAALGPADETVARLRDQVRAGAVVLADERDALSAVVDSFVEAVRAAGAPAAAVRALRRDANSLKEVLGR